MRHSRPPLCPAAAARLRALPMQRGRQSARSGRRGRRSVAEVGPVRLAFARLARARLRGVGWSAAFKRLARARLRGVGSSAATALLLATSTAQAADTAFWAGHQVVEAKRDLPLLGEITTSMETFMLAKVSRTPDGLTLEQRPCRVLFERKLGVEVIMPARTMTALPTATIRWSMTEEGYRAGPWTVGWGAEDLDGDGHPGATVRVDAPMCSGELYVANKSVSSAEATKRSGGGLKGFISVHTDQKILGAAGTCLRMLATDTRREQTGRFAYTPLDAPIGCRALLEKGWPVDVEQVDISKESQ